MHSHQKQLQSNYVRLWIRSSVSIQPSSCVLCHLSAMCRWSWGKCPHTLCPTPREVTEFVQTGGRPCSRMLKAPWVMTTSKQVEDSCWHLTETLEMGEHTGGSWHMAAEGGWHGEGLLPQGRPKTIQGHPTGCAPREAPGSHHRGLSASHLSVPH